MLFDLGSTFSKFIIKVCVPSSYVDSIEVADIPLIKTLSLTNSTKILFITSVITGD